jgi:DNA-directed RNA polymerase specialized sigma24 family protein
MTSPQDSGTRITLLGRLRNNPTDGRAWAEFVDHYGVKIYGWCRKWRLQEADAQDVTLAVLLKLAAKMRDFTYDPSRSFRAWLRTLTHHAWSDFLERRGRAGWAAAIATWRICCTPSKRATICCANWKNNSITNY